MASYQTSYAPDDEDEQERLMLEQFLAMDAEPAAPAAPVGAQPSPMLPPPEPPEPDEDETLQALSRMEPADTRPEIPWSSYDAPPQVAEKDNKWLWVATALDAVLNGGESVPQYIAQIAQPDTSAQQNWKARNEAMNDASSRAAQQAQAERASRGTPVNDLARQRFEADQAEKKRLRSLEGPEVEQWRSAAVEAGYVTPEQAAKMSIEQLKDFRPTMGQAVSQQRGAEIASKGREQSHALAVKRQGLANDLATGRITYQDFLAQQRAIDEGDAKAEGEALKTAPDAPAVVQDNSEKYGQEIRLRGLDNIDAAINKVETMLAQYPEGADIPGFGVVDGALPDAMVSEEARAMRGAVRELQDAKLRAATGAAAPPSEFKTYGAITGTNLFNTEADLRRGVGQAREFVDTQKGYVSEMYPSARQAGGTARPQARKQRKATPRPASSMGGGQQPRRSAPKTVVPADDLEF